MVTLGLCGTLLAAAALLHAERERVTRALALQAALVQTLVTGEIRRYTGFLSDLAAALGAQAQLEAPEFAAMTAQVDRGRLPGASALSMVVPASLDRIPQVQAYWRARGVTGLTLRPNGAADEHRFVVLSRTLDGTGSAVGRDLTASGEASEALGQARDTGTVTASRTYRLLRDALLPVEKQQLSFLFAAPIRSASPEAADVGEFRGWLVMGLRGEDFLRQTIGLAAGDGVAVTLSDGTAGDVVPVAGWRPAARLDTTTPALVVTVTAAQRAWQLAVAPTVRLLPGGRHSSVFALLIGGTLTALLAVLIRTVLTSRDRAVRQVEVATAALREDIARREAVEAQLRHREIELKGFAGVVAHDLRNPLARVIGYADVLREHVAAMPPEPGMFLDRLQAGTSQMQQLIDDLLDYATADNRVLEPVRVDLDELAAAVLHDRVGPGPGPRPTVVLGALPVVEGDPTLLRQVFDNLIGNALKYTRSGEAAQVEIDAAPAGDDGWRIEVRDRGIGIPPDQRAAVFDAFVRAPGGRPYPGTGLGLAIVARIVERHGGRIDVEDNPGGGSVFWFTLKQRVREVVA